VTTERKSPSPLPAALLTLAVVVCLGGVAQAGQPQHVMQQARRAAIADRDGLGQLVAALTDAARKLGHHKETQPAMHRADLGRWLCVAPAHRLTPAAHGSPQPELLRAELSHLPPPALG